MPGLLVRVTGPCFHPLRGRSGRPHGGRGIVMTKRLVAVLGAAVVGVCMWAGLVSASRSSVGAGERFVSRTTHSHYVDNTPKDLSAGDILTQHSVWRRNGTKVGTMELVATVTLRSSEQTGQILYDGVAKLADGQIAFAG